MNINNNNNSLTTWEKPTEMNFKMFGLINSSSLSERMFLLVLLHPSHFVHLQTTPWLSKCSLLKCSYFYMKFHTPWDKLIEKVLADFQKDLLFLRHCSWSLWK